MLAAAAIVLFNHAAGAQVLGYASSQGTIQVFDPAAVAVVNVLPVGEDPSISAISSDGGTLYLPDNFSGGHGTLDLISTQTGVTMAQVSGFYALPRKAVLSQDGKRVYVLCNEDGEYGSVAVVNLAALKVTFLIKVGAAVPMDIALSPNGGTLFVSTMSASGQANRAGAADGMPKSDAGTSASCPQASGICAFNASTFALTGQAPNVNGYLSVSQNGRWLYAAAGYTGFTSTPLFVVNTSTFVASKAPIPQGFPVSEVLVSPVGNSAIILSSTTAGVAGYVLNTTTNEITGTFPTPPNTGAAAFLYGFSAFTPDGSSVWTLSACAGNPAGCDSLNSPVTLTGQSFPGGSVIGQITMPNYTEFVAFPQ